MATVSFQFPPFPEHVRTARLVVGAAARREGVAEELVDELRLAVGEACTCAVLRHQSAGLTNADITVEVEQTEAGFAVSVRDEVTTGADSSSAALPTNGTRQDNESTTDVDIDALDFDEDLAIALIRGLAPVSDIEDSVTGRIISMTWPLSNRVN